MEAKTTVNTPASSVSLLMRWPPSSCNKLMLFHHTLLLLTHLKKPSLFPYSSGLLQTELCLHKFFPYSSKQPLCVLLCDASSVHKPSFSTLIPREQPCLTKLPFASSSWLTRFRICLLPCPLEIRTASIITSLRLRRIIIFIFLRNKTEMGHIIQITIYRKKKETIFNMAGLWEGPDILSRLMSVEY